MRRGLTNAYSGLAYIIVALVAVQFFLAGMGIFGASSFDAHESVGRILHGLTLIVVLLAIAGPRTGRDIGMSVALLAITTLQIYLPETRGDAPAIAAFHPLVALIIMGLASHIGSRYLARGRGSVAPAA
jgi:hypothetical protein